MKLATYKDGSRDGQLIVVSRDLASAHFATGIATRMQQLLDDWNFLSPQLQDLYVTLNQGKARHAFEFVPEMCAAPLPRAYQWADGSAYLNHVELVRAARKADVPGSFYEDPLMYQGGSDDFLGARDDAPFASPDWGIDFESEIAVVTGDVAIGATPDQALEGVRLLMLANDWSLRNLIPERARQGLRLLPEQAGHRVQPGRGDARRARRRLEGRPRPPHLDVDLERQEGRHVRGRAGDDVPLRAADRACVQDAQCARRLHHRLGHGQQQGLDQGLQLHRREALHRDHRGRRARRPRSCSTATPSASR